MPPAYLTGKNARNRSNTKHHYAEPPRIYAVHKHARGHNQNKESPQMKKMETTTARGAYTHKAEYTGITGPNLAQAMAELKEKKKVQRCEHHPTHTKTKNQLARERSATDPSTSKKSRSEQRKT